MINIHHREHRGHRGNMALRLETYEEFIKSKHHKTITSGVIVHDISDFLYDFQADIVRWALRQGRAAIFADCGLGKTPMQLEWARIVHEYTKGNVLILAPLAVSQQTIREGVKFGIKVNYCRSQKEVCEGITITNYEMMEHFDPADFAGIVLDESSILKSYTGKYRNLLINNFKNTPYKLACTATPSPNDYMELGNHSEFIGTMTRTEMLSMFFVHDGGETQKWRIKGHAQEKFWEWVCSWAVMLKVPSDLGYDDNGFILPKLKIHDVKVAIDISEPTEGLLFRMPSDDLQGRHRERKLTIHDRINYAADIINKSDDAWVVWCNLNEESALLKKAIEGAVEIKGSDKREHKVKSMLDFPLGKIKVLVTKPKIAGFGMNWQHCHKVAFVGLSDSYEQFYQAIRRCWRFGQEKEVDCYIITAETEGAVVENIKRKERDATEMAKEMVKHMQVYNKQNLKKTVKNKTDYKTTTESSDMWTVYMGDCVTESLKIKDSSVHYSIFSPPFADLYCYSDSDRDMGNCKSGGEFFEHFRYLIKELFRVMMDGRLVSFHCMNLPTSKTREGYIGIRDFRGDLIRAFLDEGFIYHSEVCIWKSPVVAVTRTKALGLLHKQMTKDSSMSRQGIPDYLVTMRKPGENPEPVEGRLTYFCGDRDMFQRKGKLSIDIWQKYASPVWMDINPSRTLQKQSARHEKDEKHICPLQLDVIERGIQLWSNENDTVFSPFMGIGSEGHVALKMGRRFIGIELKESYYKQAVNNLRKAEIEDDGLFMANQESQHDCANIIGN